jgi:hypothetical protein
MFTKYASKIYEICYFGVLGTTLFTIALPVIYRFNMVPVIIDYQLSAPLPSDL